MPDSKMLESFRVNLKQLRENKKLTQKDLADAAGITATTVSAYESSVKNPSLEVVIAIANVLDVSLNELCGFEENQEIGTFGQFIKLLVLLAESPAIELSYGSEYGPTSLVLNNAFKEFEEKFFEMLSLYKKSTIKKSLLSLWAQNEAEEYKDTNIVDAVNEWELEQINRQIQASESLPF